MGKIEREAGDISTDFQPGLQRLNNYAPFAPAAHPHETRWLANYEVRKHTIHNILKEKTTPISIAKARLHFGDSSIWDGPSLVGLILMAKPPGPERPLSFPKHVIKEPYKPRCYPLNAAFRTLWRCGRSVSPETLIREKVRAKATGNLPPKSDIESMSVIPIPYETNLENIRTPQEPTHSTHILPRGLIVPCRLQVDPCYRVKDRGFGFHRGFPYPRALMMMYNITEHDWNSLCEAIHDVVRPYTTDAPWFGGVKTHGEVGADIPELIDLVLDTVSKWDASFFRPKGLIMRLDMPGEARFGLTTMDIYHKTLGKLGHIDNCQGILSHNTVKFEKGRTRRSTIKFRHLRKLLESTYSSTRLVFDEISVLRDTETAYERGWMVWNASCHWARVLKGQPKAFPCGFAAARVDRWPRSKHLYYERFVGNYTCTAKEITEQVPKRASINLRSYNFGTRSYQTTYIKERTMVSKKRIDPHGTCVWNPALYSMDQRTNMFATRIILPAECAPARIESRLNSKTMSMDTKVYWEQWALEVLEQDGYFENPQRRVGTIYKRTPRRQIRVAKNA